MSIARRMLPFVALSTVGATMLDIVEPTKLPPTECPSGCAEWSQFDPSIWTQGRVPKGAGSSCAQPGRGVGAYAYGSWCYCKPNATDAETPAGEWNDDGVGRCETTVKQFGDVPPKGFYYDTQAGLTGSLYYSKTTVSLDECKAACAGLDGCKYVSWGHGATPDVGYCYVAKTCGLDDLHRDITYYHTYTTNRVAPTGYCVSGEGVPEQVNVQIAGPDSIVVSFVTFEKEAPVDAPTMMLARAGAATAGSKTLTGVTHVHKSPSGDRTYYMHFVRAGGLDARARYDYTVRSGGAGAVDSPKYSFRAPYSEGETKIDIFGDMGVYSYNNMEQLYGDCVDRETADLIVQMGDHAYNEGEGDGQRGDGYMSAYQSIVANCPWMPVVGNHEYYDGEELARYLDQTWEKWGPIPGGNTSTRHGGRSTATSALGALLSTGNHHAAGTHGSLPSNTSRYFSVDFGLVHLIALDLNVYYGVDACSDPCKQAQKRWLEEDLKQANANRERVPWVIAMSHYPFYCTGCDTNEVSGAYYASDDAELYGNNNATAADSARGRECATATAGVCADGVSASRWKGNLGQSARASIADLIPLIDAGGVDMFLAGHWHYYESLWPGSNGKTGNGGSVTQYGFVDPGVAVHVTTGNGGPPGNDTFGGTKINMTRFQTTAQGYGRLTAYNATAMKYQQFWTFGQEQLIDEFTLIVNKHGPRK